MTDREKCLSGLSLLFFGSIILYDPMPSLLFLALIPLWIVLLVFYRFCFEIISRQEKGTASAAAEDLDAQMVAVKSEHRKTLVKVTVTWIGSGIFCAYSAFVLKLGLGAEWLPFARSLVIRKGDPLYGYAMMDGVFVTAGFLFLSGLVWLPMYYFFEGMTAKQKIAAMLKSGNAHA